MTLFHGATVIPLGCHRIRIKSVHFDCIATKSERSDGRGSNPRALGIFLDTTFKAALGSTQPPIQWIPVAPSLGVKRPGREADHSPPSSAEVKNAWSYTSIPLIRLHGVMLS
jgi:hypothetical protein